MKKTAAATKTKATKTPATTAPAEEAVTAATQPKKATRPARKAKAAKPAKKASTKKVAKQAGTTKKDQVLALISRAKGASLDEIMEAMGWQRHTVRGFISILNKAGTKIESTKTDKGERTYKAA